MYLEAHLDLFTLSRLVEAATPVRIHFGKSGEDQRWIEIAKPKTVSLRAGEGMIIETSARVHYAWGGMQPEIEIRAIELLMRPVVEQGEEGLELRFHLDIEDADLVNVPALIDVGVVGVVNAAITPTATRMLWAFEKSLRVKIPMPDRLEPLGCFSLSATGGSATVHEEHVCLRVSFDAQMSRTEAEPLGSALVYPPQAVTEQEPNLDTSNPTE